MCSQQIAVVWAVDVNGQGSRTVKVVANSVVWQAACKHVARKDDTCKDDICKHGCTLAVFIPSVVSVVRCRVYFV